MFIAQDYVGICGVLYYVIFSGQSGVCPHILAARGGPCQYWTADYR